MKQNNTSRRTSGRAKRKSASGASGPTQKTSAKVIKNRRPQNSSRNASSSAVAGTTAAALTDQAASAPSRGRRGKNNNNNKNNNGANQITSQQQRWTGAQDQVPLKAELILTDGKKTTLEKQLDTDRDMGGLIVFVYPTASSEEAIDYVHEFDRRVFDYERSYMGMIGVSPDSSSANAKFETDKQLHFTLLSDPQKTVLNAIGLGSISKTDKKFKTVGVFVMDKSGALLYVKSGKPEKVLEDLDRKMQLEIMGPSDDEGY